MTSFSSSTMPLAVWACEKESWLQKFTYTFGLAYLAAGATAVAGAAQAGMNGSAV